MTRTEPQHITDGRRVAETLSDDDIKAILIQKLQAYIQRNDTLEAFQRDIGSMGGTFGNHYGWWDSGAVTRPYVDVKLRSGRVIHFKKSHLYESEHKSLNTDSEQLDIEHVLNKKVIQEPQS